MDSVCMNEIKGVSLFILKWVFSLFIAGYGQILHLISWAASLPIPTKVLIVIIQHALCIAHMVLQDSIRAWNHGTENCVLVPQTHTDNLTDTDISDPKPRIPGTWPEKSSSDSPKPPSPPDQAVCDPEIPPDEQVARLKAEHKDEFALWRAIYERQLKAKNDEIKRLKSMTMNHLINGKHRNRRLAVNKDLLPEVVQKRLHPYGRSVHTVSASPRQEEFKPQDFIQSRRELTSSIQEIINAYHEFKLLNFLTSLELVMEYREKHTVRPVPEIFNINTGIAQANASTQTSDNSPQVDESTQSSSKAAQVDQSTQTCGNATQSFSPLEISPLTPSPLTTLSFSPLEISPLTNSSLTTSPLKTLSFSPLEISPITTSPLKISHGTSAKGATSANISTSRTRPQVFLTMPTPVLSTMKTNTSSAPITEMVSSLVTSPFSAPVTSPHHASVNLPAEIKPEPKSEDNQNISAYASEVEDLTGGQRKNKDVGSMAPNAAPLKKSVLAVPRINMASLIKMAPIGVPLMQMATDCTFPINEAITSQAPTAVPTKRTNPLIDNDLVQSDEMDWKPDDKAVSNNQRLLPTIPAVPEQAKAFVEDEEMKIDESEDDDTDTEMEGYIFKPVQGIYSPPGTPPPASSATVSHSSDHQMIDAPQIRPSRDVEMKDNDNDPQEAVKNQTAGTGDEKMSDVKLSTPEVSWSPPTWDPTSYGTPSLPPTTPTQPIPYSLDPSPAEPVDDDSSKEPWSPIEELPEDDFIEKALSLPSPRLATPSPSPDRQEQPETTDEDRSAELPDPPVLPPSQAPIQPPAQSSDLPAAAKPKIKIIWKKKTTSPMVTPKRPKPKVEQPYSSPRPQPGNSGAIKVEAPRNWKTSLITPGAQLMVQPMSSLKPVIQHRTNLPTDAPRPLRESQKPTGTTDADSAATAPASDAPGNSADRPPTPSPRPDESPKVAPLATGILATPSVIPGLSYPAPPPPMPPSSAVRSEPPKTPLSTQQIEIVLSSPPKSPSRAPQEIGPDDLAVFEGIDEYRPRPMAKLRRRRLGDDQTRHAQAVEHTRRKQQLQEEENKLRARILARPVAPLVAAVIHTPPPSIRLVADLGMKVGSREIDLELERRLSPLWNLLDARQVAQYGTKSLTQLGLKRWNELIVDRRYSQLGSISRKEYEGLVDKWMDAFVTETLVEHLIVLNDAEAQEEIMKPWFAIVRQAREQAESS
ncbi:hypothetical protein CORC01_07976 [Colletotrichum orchidophilum]|uniref:Uncharacterized protein n=1 Tax=Colletotrichum orchidophilum TaxID=1209926 RepID=A0A1G4B5E9_9PEZI|nr:uncharacterized protein CORC01_07976 [Colletotrichum orchidophilum]OHE96659.1 hypothetical protein CORC01_07976 [Colletotrichum orchidophilum]